MRFYVIILLCFIFSCAYSEDVVITLIDKQDNEIKIAVPQDTETFSLFSFFTSYKSISGIGKLKNVKKLDCTVVSGITDYSFIAELPNIEILILDSCTVESFSFLNNLKNLRVLSLKQTNLSSREQWLENNDLDEAVIDFSENKNLEYLEINRVNMFPPTKPFNLTIKNIPKSLKHLYLYADEEFLNLNELVDTFSSVDHIYFRISHMNSDEKEKIENYYGQYKNIVIGDKEIPSKYLKMLKTENGPEIHEAYPRLDDVIIKQNLP